MAGIRHATPATLPDDPLYEIKSSNWNEDHDVDPEAITEAMIESAARIPVGGIIMWSGAIAAIPTRWALCDGTANAPGPDLRDKFVVGAKQDQAGVAKSEIEGSLKVSGGATGHSHSGHANLSHAGAAVGDHTGLTHSLAIADHPDLTHAALSHAATTITQPAATVPTHSGSHAAVTGSRPSLAVAAATASRPSGSIASHAGGSTPAQTVTFTSQVGTATTGVVSVPALTITVTGVNSGAATGNTSLNRIPPNASTHTANVQSHTGSQPSVSVSVGSQTLPVVSAANASGPTRSFASGVDVSVPSQAIASGVDVSVPTGSHSHASSAVAVADLSLPSLSHQAIGTHRGTDYGVHQITAPAAHGVAGTLSHSVTQADPHAISAHDTVSNVPSYYALAFIQRMAA